MSFLISNPAKLVARLKFIAHLNILIRIYFSAIQENPVNICCILLQILFLPQIPARLNL
jgi:hypothetical protein